MPNPNPCHKTRFKTNRPESCIATLTIKVPPTLKEKLKGIDNWHEDTRQFLSNLVEEKSS